MRFFHRKKEEPVDDLRPTIKRLFVCGDCGKTTFADAVKDGSPLPAYFLSTGIVCNSCGSTNTNKSRDIAEFKMEDLKRAAKLAEKEENEKK